MLNAGLILAGRSPDIVNALRSGTEAGQQVRDFDRQNNINALYQEQGADIAAGNQNALNALAGFSPEAALNVQGARQNLEQSAGRFGMDQQTHGLSMQRGQLDMQATRQQMASLSARDQMAIEQHAASLSAAEREQQRLDIEADLAVLATAQDDAAWDRLAVQTGNPDLVGQFGRRDEEFAKYQTLGDVLSRQSPPEPADEYGRYVQEERAAGREPLSRIDFSQAKKGEGVVVTNADGSQIRVGGRAQSDTTSPSSPAAMISSIDGILSDPALDSSTGMLSILQSVPGTPQRRFGARANQLEGQAFLQAFESLKGGGQITEIEGQKATQAIGRLDTAQSADDYRAALNELRDVLSLAQSRPVGWVDQQGVSITPQSVVNMTPQQVQQYMTDTPLDQIPDDVLDALIARGE